MATTQMLPAGWYTPPHIRWYTPPKARWYTWGDYAWYSLARRPTLGMERWFQSWGDCARVRAKAQGVNEAVSTAAAVATATLFKPTPLRWLQNWADMKSFGA